MSRARDDHDDDAEGREKHPDICKWHYVDSFLLDVTENSVHDSDQGLFFHIIFRS